MVTNADQWKWRKIRICAVSRPAYLRLHAVPLSLLAIERLERARCATARETGVSKVNGPHSQRGCASRSLQSLNKERDCVQSRLTLEQWNDVPRGDGSWLHELPKRHFQYQHGKRDQHEGKDVWEDEGPWAKENQGKNWMACLEVSRRYIYSSQWNWGRRDCLVSFFFFLVDWNNCHAKRPLCFPNFLFGSWWDRHSLQLCFEIWPLVNLDLHVSLIIT